jgi:hypothetical protein
LKLSYPFDDGAEPEDLNYDDSLAWVVSSEKSGLKIARVSVR